MILAAVGPLNTVFGAAATFLLTIVALCLLLVLFYTTIDQMRPSVIMGAIHGHILKARARQADLLGNTRRASVCSAPVRALAVAGSHGFVNGIDIRAIAAAAASASAETEVTLSVSVGGFVAYGDTIAEVKAYNADDATRLATATEAAVRLAPQRDITTDPLKGIKDLANIAWTSISTAQSDPEPGQLAIYNLRDLQPARRACPLVLRAGSSVRNTASPDCVCGQCSL